MISKLRLISILIFSMAYLVNCDSEPAGEWTFKVESAPLSFQFTQQGRDEAISVAEDQKSPLFYITGQDTQYVTDLREVIAEGEDHFEAVYSTSDQRTAKVSLEIRPEGSLSFQFSVAPDSGITRKGLSIKAGQNESYYGLMEESSMGSRNVHGNRA